MKQPNSKNYIGNPMGYFNDKAQYGKETAPSNFDPIKLMKEAGDASRSRRQDRLDAKLARKDTRREIAGVNSDIAREKSDRRTSRKQNRFYNNQ